jgi:hypothetical protein
MTDALAAPALTAYRSAFVTVLAWLGIAGFSLAALMFGAQAVVIWPMIEHSVMTQLAADSVTSVSPQAAEISAAATLYVFVAFIAFALIGIAASVGLLRRRNWGRVLIIIFLAFGILGALFGLLGGLMMGSMPATAPLAGVSSAQFEQIMSGVRVLMMGGSVLTALLCSWLIYKLISKPVSMEFATLET